MAYFLTDRSDRPGPSKFLVGYRRAFRSALPTAEGLPLVVGSLLGMTKAGPAPRYDRAAYGSSEWQEPKGRPEGRPVASGLYGLGDVVTMIAWPSWSAPLMSVRV